MMSLLLALALAGDVTVVENLAYKAGPSDYERERCRLDLYVPKDAKGAPVLVWFHGGGLKGGDKTSGAAVGRRFAAEGILVASVNYRLSPQATYPAYNEDAAAAVAWARAHAAEHGGDPARLFVSGHSAGGYLSAIVASDPSYLAKHGLPLSALAGAIPVSGQMDVHSTVREERGVKEAAVDASAPLFHATADVPPMLLIAGGDDLPGRAALSVRFHEALAGKGHKDVSLLVVGKRDHGTIASRIGREDDVVAAAMLRFLRERSAR
jgi:acetyl esterase/lipase